MSALRYDIPVGYGVRRPSRPRVPARLGSLVAALGLCLPVPAFAATGLSIPMPAAVERLAAALVPWAEPAPLFDQAVERGARGAIVLTEVERKANGVAVGRTRPAPPPQAGERKASKRTGPPARERGTSSAPQTASARREAAGAAPTAAAPASAPAKSTPRVGASDPKPDRAMEPAAAPTSDPMPAPKTQPTKSPVQTPMQPQPVDPSPLPVPASAPVQDTVETVDQVIEAVDRVKEDKLKEDKLREDKLKEPVGNPVEGKVDKTVKTVVETP